MAMNPIDFYLSGSKMSNEKTPIADFYIPTPISFIFETDSLLAASPATVSRLGVILVSDLNI
jgi:hypothetical protein